MAFVVGEAYREPDDRKWQANARGNILELSPLLESAQSRRLDRLLKMCAGYPNPPVSGPQGARFWQTAF
ncbi:MAG TPA: hypothetical protein VFX11_02465 [Candidatus Kapabacteria bacterium]|nr:hypothetical protein [Candidatus Kapabacteria bacterium]